MVSGATFILAAFVLYISDTFQCRLRLFLRLSLLTLPIASTGLQTWKNPLIIRLILNRETHSLIRLRIGAGTSGLPYAAARHTARLGVHAAAPRPVPLQVTESINIRLSSAVKFFLTCLLALYCPSLRRVAGFFVALTMALAVLVSCISRLCWLIN